MHYKKIFYGILFIFLVAAVFYSYQQWDNRFNLKNITYDGSLPHSPHLNPATSDIAHVKTILNQEFSYLGQGHQSYAFASKDDQYVIKFFKFNHLKPRNFDNQKVAESRQKKMKRIFASHELAYNEDAEQCGIIYMQLTPDGSFDHIVKLKDQFGLQQNIDLSQVVFVLQYKAIPTRELLTRLARKNDVDGVILHLSSLLDLYIADYKRGIMDDDHNIMYNTGFFQGRPIRIDSGKLLKNPDLVNIHVFMKDLHKIVYRRIDKWLESHNAQNYEIVMEALDKKINEIAQ